MWKGLLLLCLANCCCAYRILGFFPMPAVSHHRSFAYPILELARRGHQIVYVTPIQPDFSHQNVEVRLMKDFRDIFSDTMRISELSHYFIPIRTFIMQRTSEILADEFYGDPVVQDLVHGNETFDGVMVESYTIQEPVTALVHKFGAPVIEIAALGDINWLYEMGGLPTNPAYMMDYTGEFTDTMTLKERIQNFFLLWANTMLCYFRLPRVQRIMDKYFNYTGWESRPHIGQLLSNRSIILQNRDVIMDYPFPLPPHVKDIGGINVIENKPLPKDLQKYMDESTNGVILFSLGSMLNTSGLTRDNKFGRAFFSAFKKLPQNVIMKSEVGKLDYLPPNVETYKWLPQNDILAHKNCVLFITHGGYNSLVESVYHEVPVVGIPFFADQPKDMIQVANSGLGVMIVRENVTEESLLWAINEVLNNPKYKAEVKRRSQMMKEAPNKAADRAVYWIEFAIKYPNFLTPRSAYMNFFQVHCLDVKLIIFGSIYILYKAIAMLLSYLRKNIKPKQKLKTS